MQRHPVVHEISCQPMGIHDHTTAPDFHVMSIEPTGAAKHDVPKTQPSRIDALVSQLPFEMDVRSVGALRIALALLVLYDVFMRVTDTLDWMAAGATRLNVVVCALAHLCVSDR